MKRTNRKQEKLNEIGRDLPEPHNSWKAVELVAKLHWLIKEPRVADPSWMASLLSAGDNAADMIWQMTTDLRSYEAIVPFYKLAASEMALARERRERRKKSKTTTIIQDQKEDEKL